MRRLAALDDHAAADNGALFPVIGMIGLPVGNAMTCCRKDYACLVGNFGCTGCILKPLVTAVAGVICRVAFLRASRSLCEKYKEKPDICNAVGAHHDEVEMQTLLAPIVQVCDAISGARPGARREIVEDRKSVV